MEEEEEEECECKEEREEREERVEGVRISARALSLCGDAKREEEEKKEVFVEMRGAGLTECGESVFISLSISLSLFLCAEEGDGVRSVRSIISVVGGVDRIVEG